MARPKSGYRLKDGTEVPGTTTIAGRWKDSSALIGWAYKQGRDGKKLYEERDEAGEVGTFIHELAEWHINGEQDKRPEPAKSLDPDAVARGERGYQNFLNWEEQNGLYIVSWEKPLVSEKYKFGGTPDGIFELNGVIAIGDWKSSKRLYADGLLQFAAYILLWDEAFPDNPITGGAHVVRFSKTFGDFEHRYFDNLDIEKRQFILLREAFENDKLIKQRV